MVFRRVTPGPARPPPIRYHRDADAVYHGRVPTGALIYALGAGLVAWLVGSRRRGSPSTGPHSLLPAWPLPEWPPGTVQEWRSGPRSLGAERSDHVHAGVDIGPPKLAGQPSRAYGSPVVSITSGTVVEVGLGWAGDEAKRIDVMTDDGRLIVYGAVQPQAAVAVGQRVGPGQLLGWVGKYPGGSTMLHLEEHVGQRQPWDLGGQQPSTLLDPRQGVLSRWV